MSMKYQFLELLVGGFSHLEKYEFVNGWWIIPYIMENKTCLKPPHNFPHNFQSRPARGSERGLLARPLSTECAVRLRLVRQRIPTLTARQGQGS